MPEETKTKQANWLLKPDFVSYINRLKEDGENILEIRLDSKTNPKNIEIIMEDKNAQER